MPAAKNLPWLAALAAIFALGAFLLFHNLDGRLLWGDEAETALLARNINRFGLPRTDDGMNVISVQGPGVDSNARHIWTWAPWLPEYASALGFRLLGYSTWSARFPFALVGFLAGAYLAFLTFRVYRELRVVCVAAFLFFTCELFLLHARQCRYYAITVLAQIMLAHGVYLLLERERRGAWLISLALMVQFYCNFLIAGANLPALALLPFLRRRSRPELLKSTVAAGAVFAALALPWLAYARPWRHSQTGVAANLWPKLIFYAGGINLHVFPLVFLFLPLAAFLLKRERPDENTSCWEQACLLCAGTYLLVMSAMPGPFLRYVLPLAPLLTMILSAWLFRYVRNGIAIAALTLFLVVYNGPSLRWPLTDYIRSITRPYHDRTEAVVDFFRRSALPGQTVLVMDPEFPLQFYLPLRIMDGRLRNAPPREAPDWIMSESASGVLDIAPLKPSAELLKGYEAIRVSVPRSRRGGGIPEPRFYEFFTAGENYYLTVYKRKPA